MSYNYQTERPDLFTESGQEMFLRIRDAVHRHIEQSGAVRMDVAMSAAKSGSTWRMMACVDRLVELKEIVEITGDNVAGQYRIFTKYDR